jgi:hypothetical protein
MTEEVLKEEGLQRKLSIEGFNTGSIEGCEGTVRGDGREALLREEGREGKLSIEGFKI